MGNGLHKAYCQFTGVGYKILLMKKIISLAVLVAFMGFAALVPNTLSAANGDMQKIVRVSQEETIEGNYYAGGDIIEISGTINGDAYVAGGQVIVNGVINGDLIAAGGSINVSGEIADDARLAGGNLVVSGSVGDDLSVAGGDINISDTATIGGALQSAGGNIMLAGAVGAELKAAGGMINLSSTAKVGGDFEYWSEEEANVSSGATVNGNTSRQQGGWSHNLPTEENIGRVFDAIGAFFSLTGIITTLVLGLLVIKLAPNYTARAISVVENQTLRSFLFGILALVVLPILFFVLLITLVGVPLAFITLFIGLLYLTFGKIYVLTAVGQRVLGYRQKNPSQLIGFLLGMLLYSLIMIIPVIDVLVKFLVLTVGMGAALIKEAATYRLAKKEKVV